MDVAGLRHALATVAYRAGKSIRGAPAAFADFQAGEGTRTPVQILAHMGDLFDWALAIVNGAERWSDSTPLAWEDEVERFFRALRAFDERLASGDLAVEASRLFQGPVADALTHTGQLNLLRHLYRLPVKGENYHRAEIVAGRVGQDQTAPRREF